MAEQVSMHSLAVGGLEFRSTLNVNFLRLVRSQTCLSIFFNHFCPIKRLVLCSYNGHVILLRYPHPLYLVVPDMREVFLCHYTLFQEGFNDGMADFDEDFKVFILFYVAVKNARLFQVSIFAKSAVQSL